MNRTSIFRPFAFPPDIIEKGMSFIKEKSMKIIFSLEKDSEIANWSFINELEEKPVELSEEEKRKIPYDEKAIVDELNKNPDLYDKNPDEYKRSVQRMFNFEDFKTKHFIRKVCDNPGVPSKEMIRFYRNVYISQNNMLQTIELAESKEDGLNKTMANFLSVHFGKSIQKDWYNIVSEYNEIYSYNPTDEQEIRWKKYLIEFRKKLVDGQITLVKNSLLSTAFRNGLISIYDHSEKHFAKYISYQAETVDHSSMFKTYRYKDEVLFIDKIY